MDLYWSWVPGLPRKLYWPVRVISWDGLKVKVFCKADNAILQFCSEYYSKSISDETDINENADDPMIDAGEPKDDEGVSKTIKSENCCIYDRQVALLCHKFHDVLMGFPDYHPPQHVVEKFTNVIKGDNPLSHQYTRSYGNPHLVNTLAKLYSPILQRQVDPMSEVFVSVGAFGVLFSTIQGLINPGDEVIIIEPFFDCYEPMVRVAGGVPVFIPLRATKEGSSISSHDWKLDEKELASKFSDRTKAIMLNNPNNPVGKVYKEDELQTIADLCIKHDVMVIADEVYEWMIYKGHKHIKIATLPGMWERTITIGSAGKTFSATGWKLGWGVGPADLIQALHVLHQNSIYTCPTPIQETVAIGLDYELSVFEDENECYLKSLALELEPKRDALAKVLVDLGMKPTIPEGGYFMMADTSSLNVDIPDDGSGDPYDFKFVRWMTKEKRLSAIPPSAFYGKEHKNLGEKYIRFCFIKEDNTLDAAAKILTDWKSDLQAK